MTRETQTAADAERAARVLQRDPAAQAYGDHLRRKGLLVKHEGSVCDFAQNRKLAVRT